MDSDLEDALSIGVTEYLKEWGLSQSTIANFEENQISFELLDSIQETELKELIPSLKERILFKRGLNKLQNIIHDTESDETVSIDSNYSAPSPTASTSSNGLLTTKEKSPETYYIPSQKFGRNKYIPARGKLADKYNNHKRLLRKSGVIIKNQRRTDAVPADAVAAVENESVSNEEYEEIKVWLKYNKEPVPEVLEKWRQTSKLRIKELESQKYLKVADIVNDWPSYKLSFGYKLIELDFESKFKGSELLLYKKWPNFLEKAFNHFKTIKAASVYINLIEENPSEDVRDFCFCAAIGFKIVPTVRIQSNKDGIKKTIKPSIKEAMNSFILHAKTVPPPPAPAEMQARHSFWWHLLIDLPILLLVAAVCILLEVGALPSRRSGFVCNDPALSFPHVGDTFSLSIVGAITVIVPFIILWAVESSLYQGDEYSMKKSRLSTSAKTAALIYKDYIYGAVFNLIILEVIKCVVGSPRPTFFELCKPDKLETCEGSKYVTDYTCTSEYSQYLRIDSIRSFPSGHSSLSVYCGLFLAWYLQRRAFSWHSRSVLAAPLLQALCLAYAAVCSLTRVSDHRHHWWDVLFGASMGVLSALYTILVLCKNFSHPTVVSTSDISSSDGTQHNPDTKLLPNRVLMP